MDVIAKVTSKGQVTLPKAVRDAVGIEMGDRLLFRVEDGSTTLTRIPDLIDLAGAVEVPPGKRGVSWEEIRSQTQRAWAEAANRS